MNKQPFRLGTGGAWGFRGGDRGQRTSTWRCSTMNKQQPFRLGTGGGWGFRGGDRGQGASTWRCLGCCLGGTGVLGVGTGDRGLRLGDVLQ